MARNTGISKRWTEVVELYRSGLPADTIAKKFGCSGAMIARILKKRIPTEVRSRGDYPKITHSHEKIELTGTNLEWLYSYDPSTGEFFHKTGRGPRSGGIGSVAGHRTNCGYIMMAVGDNKILAQRLAWVWMTGKWPQDEIDHINGNRADNRWSNLREADRSQQSQNGKIRSSNKMGRLGVFYDKSRDQYTASIEIRGRRWRKRFATLDEAIAARALVEKEWFGEFAPSLDRTTRQQPCP